MSRFLLLMVSGLGALAAAVLFAQGERERGFATGEDTWVPAAPMPTVRAYHHAVELADGRVMVFGGLDGTGIPPAPVIYDPALDSWSPADTGWGTAFTSSVTRLDDGTVLVTTLTTGDTVTKARRFDPATNTWSAAGSLVSRLSQHTATLRPDGTVVVIGGWDSEAMAPNLAIERYSPATNDWSVESGSGHVHVGHTATMLPNGSILIAGGYDGYAGYPPPELYTAGTWAPAGTTPPRNNSFTATLMSNGKVLVVGGRTSLPQGGNPLIDPEIYDPASNTWSPAGSLLVQLHTATSLPNGLVLVVGGSDTNIRASARVYIPSANDWAFVSPMSVPRRAHGAALLSDGRVLVMGGESPTGFLATAEIYTPPSVIPPPNTATVTATPTNTATPTPTNTPDGSTFTFTPTVTDTPTGTPTSSPQDSDGDGCRDGQENGSNPQYGGLRDPFNPYDFYDVNSTRKIDGIDIGLVRGHFNAIGPVPPEDAIYDRSPGTAEWAPGPPDGLINAVDIGLIRASFNHSCA